MSPPALGAAATLLRPADRSTFSPSPTDLRVLVSRSSKGDDSNDGLSWAYPKATITAAIAAIAAAGGKGVIQCSGGTFTEVVDLTNRSGIRLVGEGSGASQIKRPNASTTAHVVSVGGSGERSIVEGFDIDGNKANGTAGAGYYYSDSGGHPSGRLNPQHAARDLYIHDTNDNGMHVDGSSGFGGGGIYRDIWVYSADGHGVYINQPDGKWDGLDVGQSGLTGVYSDIAHGGANRFSASKSWLSGRIDASTHGRGFHCIDGDIYVGCVAQDNLASGFDLFNRTNVALVGVTADTNAGNGFDARNSRGCVVIGAAYDRGGDAGTNPPQQQFGIDASGATSLTAIVSTGTHVHSGVPGSAFNLASSFVAGATGDGYARTTLGPITLDSQTGIVTAGDPDALTAGEETLNPQAATASAGLTSQRLCLTYFTARRSESVTKVRIVSGSTAAAGVTLIRVGLYLVNADGSLTLVASTPNDATLLTATFTEYTKSLSASYAKVAGQRYAIGVLVQATTMPTVAGTQPITTARLGRGTRRFGQVAAQADLPASIAVASLVNFDGRLIWTEVAP